MRRIFSYNPTLPQAWGLVALAIVCQIVGGLVVTTWIPVSQSWNNLLAYVLCFVLMLLIVIQLGKTQGEETGRPDSRVVLSPFLFLLLLFFIPFIGIVIEPLSIWIPMPEWIRQSFEVIFQRNFPTFLSAVVLAPFAEEWLCRGVILKGLLKHCSPRKAIIWSAVLFGILHLNPWQAIPAFCIALFLGWLYWRSRSLWPCIFAHALNNSIAFFLMFAFPDMPGDVSVIDIAGNYYGYVYLAALLCSVLSGYGIWRLLDGKRSMGAPTL